MKCEICGSKIGYGILHKTKGTYVKDNKGKLHVICSECQKKYRTRSEILKQLGLLD